MQSDESLVQKLLEGKRAIVFAGFNVLNNVEHTMMSLIQREGKARFYWDYDIHYCNTKHDDYEAGYFMKQNLRDFPNAISNTELFDNFRHLKDVTFIACSTDNAAARYVSNWKGNAVVLCNEALMQPVLHTIPEAEKEVNVTMGFPVADTPVYGIIMALLKLQIEGYDSERKRFRYPFEQALRRQPLFELLNEEDCFVYQGGDTMKLLDYLLMHLRQIALHYAQIEEPNIFEQLYSETVFRIDKMIKTLSNFCSPSLTLPNCSATNGQLPLKGENKNSLPLREGGGRSLLLRLLRQMMTSTKIPFHSEPDKGMQVMGMLETRCLDFEHMLLLSVEEGNLPRSTHANSFIPETLREAFGMTTQRHRIAVYAYYFYRLVQRCEHLTCIYNESTNDGVQHEMSRFLRQMLAETDIPIRMLWLRSEPNVKTSQPISVEKTAEVMEHLRRRYDQNLPGGGHITLSPSAINTYMACPMQFYLNNVLRIRREDTPEEGISADIIGTIFHDTAEFFYEWLQERYRTSTITADMLCEKKGEDTFVIKEAIHRKLQLMLHVAFDVCWFHPTDDFDRLPEIRRRFNLAIQKSLPIKGSDYKGTALIAHDVLLRYLQELIRYDARHAPFRIIGAEKERTIVLPLKGAGGSVKVGGRIDRIDEMEVRLALSNDDLKIMSLRIVDYKTGSHEPKKDKVKMENVVSLTAPHERYYLQTFIYALAEMQRKEATLPIQPVLFFPIKAAAGDYDPSLMIDGEVVNDFANQHAEAFREGLQEILADIFNPEKPFTCTTDTKVCEYCKLQQICGKKL